MHTTRLIIIGFAALLLFNITCTKDPVGPPEDINTMTDIDGNIYHTVKIGNQEWMVENLRVTRYNDGSAISNITSDATWDSCKYTYTPAYCYYKNTTNTDNIKKWGAIYNCYAVSPTNSKKIAPDGWHVPTDAEWTILEKYLVLNGYNWDGTTDTAIDNKIAKSLTSKTDWYSSNRPGAIGNDLTTNNHSGFSALPGGERINGYEGQGANGDWWSTTERDSTSVWCYGLSFCEADLGSFYVAKFFGCSVRLVRD